MITELKEILLKVEKLGDDDQRHIAKMLNEEIQWDNTLQNSQEGLSKLAQEAVKEHQSDKSREEEW